MVCHSDVCNYCKSSRGKVWIHGHAQCIDCGTNIDECCRGECVQ